MLHYAIILLDKLSTAFCHVDNPYTESQLITVDTLRDAILWCMKKNLRIQFVYPDYELPEEYLAIIDSIDHTDIRHEFPADVTVYNGWNEFEGLSTTNSAMILRLTKAELLGSKEKLDVALSSDGHVSVVIKDIDTFTDADVTAYREMLAGVVEVAESLTLRGKMPQVSILTDRIMLNDMNNCNAGDESITIAPNGRFYICPAFYYAEETDSVGDLQSGLDIKNRQLYKLGYAPICRECDAYHCRRCIWLNRKATLEVNTPSHEQCVVAHIERNASRSFLLKVRCHGEFLRDTDIPEIDYTDPFEKIFRRTPL